MYHQMTWYILAHMPYFRRAGHIYVCQDNFTIDVCHSAISLKNNLSVLRLFTIDHQNSVMELKKHSSKRLQRDFRESVSVYPPRKWRLCWFSTFYASVHKKSSVIFLHKIRSACNTNDQVLQRYTIKPEQIVACVVFILKKNTGSPRILFDNVDSIRPLGYQFLPPETKDTSDNKIFSIKCVAISRCLMKFVQLHMIIQPLILLYFSY